MTFLSWSQHWPPERSPQQRSGVALQFFALDPGGPMGLGGDLEATAVGEEHLMGLRTPLPPSDAVGLTQ